MAYQRWWKTIRDQQGNAVNGASVAVYEGGTGTLATIYDPNTDDSAPGGLSNPFTTTANGIFGFMAADGEYDVQISGGNGATQQYRVTLAASAINIYAELANSSEPTKGSGMVGFGYSTGYGAGTIGKWLQDLATSVGATFLGYLAPFTGAVLRTLAQVVGDFPVSPLWFGATGNDSADDTAAFLLMDASAAAGDFKTIKLGQGKTYKVLRSQVLQLRDGMSILGDGATIHLPSTAVPQGDYTYGDGVFYVPSGEDVSGVVVDGVVYQIDRADIDAISVGVVGTPESATRSKVSVGRCRMTGGYNFLKARQVVGLSVTNNNTYLTGEGIFAQECSGVISGNVIRYAGVSLDLATWNNTQPIQTPSAVGMVISGNLLEYTGGTAISTTSNSDTRDVTITGNVIRNAGLGGIGVGVKADGGITKNVAVVGNIVRGFCCAPGSNAHSGIALTATGINSITDGITIDSNFVDFLGTYETWNSTTNDVDGSLNTLKAKGGVFGSTAALQCNGYSNGSALNDSGTTSITNNTIMHSPSYGLATAWLKVSHISGNTLKQCGYQRNGSDVPATASVGISVTESGVTNIANNLILDMAPGCAGGNSFGIRLVRPWRTYIAGNQMWNTTSGWCANPVSLNGSAGGFSFYGLSGVNHEFFIGKNTAYNYVSALTYFGLTGKWELTMEPGDKKLNNQSVGATSTTIAHTLGKIPKSITVVPRGNVVVWQSAPADATNIYLQGASATNVDVYLA